MSGNLRSLLEKEATARTTEDYERVFDDFVADIGGKRFVDAFAVPQNMKNADYYIERGDHALFVELKQIRTYEPSNTFLHQTFRFMSEHGGMELPIKGTNLAISGKNSDKSQWLKYYDKLRPSVHADLRTANRQLGDSVRLAAASHRRAIKGVLIFNTADFNLSTDLLFRIIERKVKYAWKAGKFRSIDFVMCGTIDMYRKGAHPLQTHQIARTLGDNFLVTAIERFWNEWITYATSDLGLKASKEFTKRCTIENVDYSASFAGKLQRCPGGGPTPPNLKPISI